MNKVDTSDIATGVAYPPSKKGFDFLQDAHISMINTLAQTMCGEIGAGTSAYVLYGCVKASLGGSNYSFSKGAIYDQVSNEVYLFPAVASIAIATAPVLTITVTNDPTADPTLFTDGSSKNVHNVRTLVVSDGALGSANINFADLITLPESWIAPSFASAWSNNGSVCPAGYYKDLKRSVRLRGLIDYAGGVAVTGSEDVNITIFTLPDGYRPAYNQKFPVYASIAQAIGAILLTSTVLWTIQVLTTGEVQLMQVNVTAGPVTTAGTYDLSSISFRIA